MIWFSFIFVVVVVENKQREEEEEENKIIHRPISFPVSVLCWNKKKRFRFVNLREFENESKKEKKKEEQKMGTFQSFRKAYGALKDSTKVGLAKVNSEFKVKQFPFFLNFHV